MSTVIQFNENKYLQAQWKSITTTYKMQYNDVIHPFKHSSNVYLQINNTHKRALTIAIEYAWGSKKESERMIAGMCEQKNGLNMKSD